MYRLFPFSWTSHGLLCHWGGKTLDISTNCILTVFCPVKAKRTTTHIIHPHPHKLMYYVCFLVNQSIAFGKLPCTSSPVSIKFERTTRKTYIKPYPTQDLVLKYQNLIRCLLSSVDAESELVKKELYIVFDIFKIWTTYIALVD